MAVNRNMLLFKFFNIGVSLKFVNILKDHSVVSERDGTFVFIPVLRDQTRVSPLLFSLFIDDIPSAFGGEHFSWQVIPFFMSTT